MKEGDRQALAELYRRHASAMLAVAERMLGNVREGEDVLQDVFVEAWRCAHQYDARMGTVRTWLVVRMRSRCLDRQRSRKAERTSYLMDEPKMAERIADEPSDDPSLSPDKFAVRKVFVTLPPEQQRALELSYFEGLSSSEIAHRLNIPQGTVKSRLSLALGKLRAALLPTGDFS
jgi:RNA polymerase sigma-70 factor (ECF subfamily)